MATRTGELRETLIEAIDDLRAGKIDAAQATAIAKLAGAVNSSIQVEINAMKELREMGRKIKASQAGELGLLPLGEESHA